MIINLKSIVLSLYLILTGKNRKRRFLRILNTEPKHRDLNENLITFRYLCHQIDKATMNKYDENKIRGEEKYYKAVKILPHLEKNEWKDSPDIKWGSQIIKKYEKWKNGEYIHHNCVNYQLGSNFFEISKRRRSIRNWVETEITESRLLEIIDLSLMAPSSCNRQPYKIVIIKNTNSDIENSQVTNDALLSKAPYIFYVTLDTRMYSEKFAPAIDAGFISQNILMSLEYFGYGGCPIYHCEMYNQKKLRKVLCLEKYYEIFLAIPFGKYTLVPEKPSRVKAENITETLSINSDIIVLSLK
jgi:nitroreductase